jgi:hypothetical protein
MPGDVYKFVFRDVIPAAEVEGTLVLSIIGVESLHGQSQARMDARHAFDARTRVVVIDASTAVGRDLSRLFLGFLTREFGPGSFRVERVDRSSEATARPEPVTA